MSELFQRPATYWLRHADRHKQSGDLVRAAVLQRHAVRAEPGSDAAHMQYAMTLHDLRCYEASNREAFRALAAHPDRTDLYGLIGCNLLHMGLDKEGLDALGHYLRANIPAMAPWHEEACELSDLYPDPFPIKRRQARLNGLLQMAARRIARGDLDGAQKALTRAGKPPYQAPNGQRELLWAVYHLRRNEPEAYELHLIRALELNFFDVPTLTSAAVLCRRTGAHIPSRMLLLRAASIARTPTEQQLVCHTADGMNMVFMAQFMLKRTLNGRYDRCPTLYDLCVCALKTGRLQEAVRLIHLCREIDPDDVPSDLLFMRVMGWEEQNLSPDEVRRAARGVSFYGSCTGAELDACARPFIDALQSSASALGSAIAEDDRLRRRLLFLLTLPLDWPVTILQIVCSQLPDDQRETLLREVLLQHPAESAAKRYAMNVLHRMNAPAPCAAWSRDRFLLTDPNRLLVPVPTFRQRQLTRFIRRLSQVYGGDIVPWALSVISRMTPAQQCRLIGDHWKIWPLALAMRWHAMNDFPILWIPVQTMSTLRLAALRDALKVLHSID